MRRWSGVWVLVVAIVFGVVVGVTFFNVGVHVGITRAANSSVVQVIRDPGFFPFGFLLFPLVIFGTFALIRGTFRHSAWDHHGGPGHRMGHEDRDQAIREWHSKLHEEGAVPNETPRPDQQ
jgi:hypothetical protein